MLERSKSQGDPRESRIICVPCCLLLIMRKETAITRLFELEELRLLILKGFSTRRRVCSPNKAGTFTINDFGLCFSIQRKRWRFFGEVRAAHGRNSYSGPHPSRLPSYWLFSKEAYIKQQSFEEGKWSLFYLYYFLIVVVVSCVTGLIGEEII